MPSAGLAARATFWPPPGLNVLSLGVRWESGAQGRARHPITPRPGLGDNTIFCVSARRMAAATAALGHPVGMVFVWMEQLVSYFRPSGAGPHLRGPMRRVELLAKGF